MLSAAFDLATALALLVLAWSLLASRDLYRAAILFIVFGFMMALAWLRLRAPDIALVEAAVGAGLTGALLLDACRDLNRERDP